jgi:hypothetical protein
MNITTSDIILLAHAGFGGIGCLAALWVFLDTLHASAGNAGRIQKVALLAAICMVGAWILGGYWYVVFYPAEKAMILKGPWPFAHNIFMETKEHLFFATAILALFLPIAAREKLYANAVARKMVLSVAMLIAVTGLAVEGAGAGIEHGAKVALLRGGAKGAQK